MQRSMYSIACYRERCKPTPLTTPVNAEVDERFPGQVAWLHFIRDLVPNRLDTAQVADDRGNVFPGHFRIALPRHDG